MFRAGAVTATIPHSSKPSTLYATFMRPLQLPPTIRTARPDEIPMEEETLARIRESAKANIVEGYLLKYNDSHDLPFSFFAEINIDNTKMWSLFKSLSVQLPEMICLVYNLKDEDPFYSGYMEKFELLNKIEEYQIEIINDGFFEIGVLYADDTFMEEIFIKSSKYLQFWGVDEPRFRNTMAEFDLFEIPNLNFIDEYPLVTEALSIHNIEAKETLEVLEFLKAITD